MTSQTPPALPRASAMLPDLPEVSVARRSIAEISWSKFCWSYP
jgi:hypothetical protein